MQKFNKIVRILTVAPIMAMAFMTWLYLSDNTLFGSAANYAACLTCLGALPLLAYPLQPIVPGFKGKGREGQRNLAMLTCFLGYLAGLVYALVVKATDTVLLIFLTYLISGLLVILTNKVFRLHASGHACGVAGPVVMLVYTLGPIGLLALPLYLLSGASSIAMGRHTLREWLLGSLLSPAAMGISLLVLSLT